MNETLQLIIVKSTSPEDASSERNMRRGYIAEDLFDVEYKRGGLEILLLYKRISEIVSIYEDMRWDIFRVELQGYKFAPEYVEASSGVMLYNDKVAWKQPASLSARTR
ncbi:jg17060 [Pararge aegeria aegeria]|uniref:Jg17060 protein n=1 Tax=Pararge aegeria aegeria TaxID=348720 RepID=A0A8S4R266_9NEOP|nr:jg17060 [Pararge aegeria aegeria]